MGATNRIKGQDVTLQVVLNNNVVAAVTNVRDFDTTMKLTKTQEGYTGRTTDDYDEMFNGFDGKISLHTGDAGVYDFLDAIKSRAQRRTPGTTINFRATLQFPNGDRPRFLYKNVFFGDVPDTFASRGAFGMISLSWSCSDRQTIS